jgi:hypothetical protein
MGSVLSDQGITVDLPEGWEGRIMVRQAPPPSTADLRAPGTTGPVAGQRGWAGELPRPIAHLANFALPADRGDFGSGAVDLMGFDNLLVVLFEHGPEAVGTALFDQARPAELHADQFDRNALQRAIPGQAGFQHFFTEQRRAFCLYVVLGSQRNATALAALATQTLRATSIAAR